MRSISLLFIAFFITTCTFAQNYDPGILQIQIYPSQLTGTCVLSGVDTVYIHAGLGWSNPDSLWETVVGNWGVDDGKGLMTKTGPDTFTICFDIREYFTQYADPDSTQPGGVGFGPMPANGIPYNIGMVFRPASCPIVSGKPKCADDVQGKDENCENIQLFGLQNPATMQVVDYGGYAFTAVTASFIPACAGFTTGVEDAGTGVSHLITYPMPFTNLANIQFTLAEVQSPKAEIFDLLGQKVADLSSDIHAGPNVLMWRGNDLSGRPVPAGIYIYKLTNNNLSFSGKLIKE